MMFDENDIETIIIIYNPEDGSVLSEEKYKTERYEELKAQYGEKNVQLQDRFAWQ